MRLERPILDFGSDVSEDTRRTVAVLLDEWALPDLTGPVNVRPMSGGASNVNLKLEAGWKSYALRICMPDAERWAVDRRAAIVAQQDAAAAGLAPKIVASRLPEGHFLSEFLPGGFLTVDRMRREALLPAVVETLRALHHVTTTSRNFSPFDDARMFVRLGDKDGAKRPPEFDELYECFLKIETFFKSSPAPRAFCHSDLVLQNFMVGDRLRLVDWDYAGIGWIAFELASFCCQGGLTAEETERVLKIYDPDVDDHQRARVALMRAVAGVREAAWAAMAEPILAGATTPMEGWTYQGYLSANLRQAKDVWASSSFEALLEQASMFREGALF